MTRIITITLATVALWLGLAGPAAAQSAVGTALDAVGGSSVRGTVTVAPAPRGTPAAQLTLELAGLTPGTRYTAHLHAGTYDQPAASFGILGQVEADAQGRGRLTATAVRFGAVGAEIALTEELLLDGDHWVDLHDAANTAARARLPGQSTTPSRLPRTGAPSLPIALTGLGALAAAAWFRSGRR